MKTKYFCKTCHQFKTIDQMTADSFGQISDTCYECNVNQALQTSFCDVCGNVVLTSCLFDFEGTKLCQFCNENRILGSSIQTKEKAISDMRALVANANYSPAPRKLKKLSKADEKYNDKIIKKFEKKWKNKKIPQDEFIKHLESLNG